MKRLQKTTCVLIALCLLVCASAFGASAYTNVTSRLAFVDGKFKTLVFSDLHFSSLEDDAIFQDQFDFINAALDQAQPNLVVFDGDNVTASGKENQTACIRELLKPIAARGLYFAVVMGNHDGEQSDGLTRAEQMAVYQEYEKCLAVVGPEGVYGVGNYNIVLQNSAKTKDIFNLWFIDSNDYDRVHGGDYGYVMEDQIAWYEATSAALAAQNGGNPLPSVLFQHIPVPEIYDLLVPCKLPWLYSVKGHSSYSEYFWTVDKKNTTFEGGYWEKPCPPDYNSGQFDSWRKMGDVKLAIFGHDHSNTFSGEVDGIRLMYCGAAGMAVYGNGIKYQASLLTVDEASLSVTREHLRFEDVVGPAAKHLSFFDYFEKDCWWSLLKLDLRPLFRCLGLAFGSLCA